MLMSSNIHPCFGFERRRIGLPFLPKEIIFEILLRLPVDILHNVMRYVCREWDNIIKDPKFIDAHLQESSTTGFLIQFPRLKCSTRYLEMREHGVETTDLNLLPSQYLQYKEKISGSHEYLKFPDIWASCNGLVLVSNLIFSRTLHVANLILKQWVSLPLVGESWFWLNAGLGYADSCKGYKVVCSCESVERFYCCLILTLGVDKTWRCIASSNKMSCIPHEVLKSLLKGEAYSTGRYVHWVCYPQVLSLEVETESFHVSDIPKGRIDRRGYFLAMESCLAFVVVLEKYIFELWALVDVESSHWKKLQNVDLAAQVPVIEQRFGLSISELLPIALLKNGELFILRISICKGYFILCNVKSGAIAYFEDESWDKPHLQHCSPFVKSLVSPKF